MKLTKQHFEIIALLIHDGIKQNKIEKEFIFDAWETVKKYNGNANRQKFFEACESKKHIRHAISI